MRYLCVPMLLAGALTVAGQHKVDPRNSYERLICVAPMIGAGTYQDPRRPLYAPVSGERSGIVAFSFLPSDDGKFALVELVARDRAGLQAVLKDRRADVKVFEKGKAKRADIRNFARLRPSR